MCAQNILSVDIGSALTKVVVGREKASQVLVKNAFVLETPAKSFTDGQIRDLEAIKNALVAEVKNRKINVKKVLFSTASSGAVIREVVLPETKKTELNAMIKFELENHLPIQIDEYILQHKLIEKFKEDETKKIRLTVAALPKEIANSYWALARELAIKPLKLEPLGLTMHSFGVAEMFGKKAKANDLNINPEITTAFIDMGYLQTNCSIVSKGNLLFNRVISAGGKNIGTVGKSLYRDYQEVAATGEENLPKSFVPTVLSESNSYDFMEECLGSWLREIRKVFRYYSGMKNELKIDQIILSGGCSNINSLDGYLRDTLEIPTEHLKHHSRISYPKQLGLDLALYFNAISAICSY